MVDFNLALEAYDLDDDFISDGSTDSLKSYADITEEDYKRGKLSKDERDSIIGGLNNTIKSINNLDNIDKLKDPNIIVKFIEWFRSLYRKILIRLSGSMDSSDSTFMKRMLKRIISFVDRLLLKLQTLLDRRTAEQISNREKLAFTMEREAIANFHIPGKYKMGNR